MSLSKPLLVGGIGGALPVMIDLINSDAASLFEGFNRWCLPGIRYGLLCLCYLGLCGFG